MSNFNPEEYWNKRKFKKWVVDLRSTRGRPETRYVGATTQERAVESAKNHSLLKGRVYCSSVRLATPFDLGCD